MNRSKRRISRAIPAAAVALALVASTLPAMAAELTGPKTLFPTHGISVDVGSKRVIGYFVADNGACNLTFLMSDKHLDDETPAASAARMKQVVASNSSTVVDTAEGESLELACQPGATAMTVRLLKQVASTAKPLQ
jgi:hypothetical protein